MLIVGLGNPGARYRDSRHNVGFRCIDAMAERWGVKLTDRRQYVVLGEGYVDGGPVVLAKPRTFMNRSGDAVSYLLARFRAGPAGLVVVYDEMDLPLGMIRLRPRGGPAGHNGMSSIIGAVGGQEFARVRVGIGRPPASGDWIDYVLGRFTVEEAEKVPALVDWVADAVRCLLTEGIDAAMNRYNTAPREAPAEGPGGEPPGGELPPEGPSFPRPGGNPSS